MLDKIVALDYAVENFLVTLRGVSQANFLAFAISASVVVFVLAAIYYYLTVKRIKKFAFKIIAGSAILYSLIEIIKYYISRPAPNLASGVSFPSGHTAFAFFLAVLLPVKPKFKILLFTWAVGVAAGRLLLGVHWLSDVVAGAGIGATGAVLLKVIE